MEHPIRDDVLVIKVTQKFLEAVPVNFDYTLTENWTENLNLYDLLVSSIFIRIKVSMAKEYR